MSGRVPLIAGNWKMHKTLAATRTLVQGLLSRTEGVEGVEIAIAPPFTALSAAADSLAESDVLLGAQNMHPREEGAFTGEISPVMLSDVGCDFVIVGHSERRTLFGETDESVGRKLRSALAHDLTPVLCCGETREEREGGRTDAVVERQLRAALEGVSGAEGQELVVAYEPVWAIGTGLTASPEQAQGVHARIREVLGELLGADVAAGIRIQYGGSVKPENAAELLDRPDIDGALVGGASLDAASFAGIVEAAAG